MDDELKVTGNLQPTEPTVDNSGLVELAQKRKVEAERKRKIFKQISKVVYIIVGLIVATLLGLYIYVSSKKVAPSTYVVTPTPTPTKSETVFDTTKPENWSIYSSNSLKVYIRKLNNTTILESTNAPVKIEVVHDRNNPNPTSGNEADLSEGYIFRVTPLNVGIRDIESMSKIKMESFKVKCPPTAVFTQLKETLVDTIDARTFEISKCNADYVIFYIPRFNIYYEIAQIYKGDVGYKQRYKAILDEMIRSFKFFPEDTPPIGPFATFIDEKSKIIFTHPSLDTTCCVLPKPPIDNITTVVMMGDKATYENAENFDGIGVFITDLYGIQGGFNGLIEKQKKLLIEDYKVVTGTEPTVSQTEVNVGKYKALRLKGYSWKGNDLIYVDIAGGWNNQIVVFSIKNKSGESFEKAVEQILSTFETY